MSQVIAQKWQDLAHREKMTAAISKSFDRRMKQRLVDLAQKAKEEPLADSSAIVPSPGGEP